LIDFRNILNAIYTFTSVKIRHINVRAEPEETSAHKSAKTHDGNVFVTRDLDFKEFPGLMVEHFYVKFCDPSCIDLRFRAEKQANKGR